jgi:hypothetical protein
MLKIDWRGKFSQCVWPRIFPVKVAAHLLDPPYIAINCLIIRILPYIERYFKEKESVKCCLISF